jgi:hypothetical protein
MKNIITCPDCGLVLTTEYNGESTVIGYHRAAWQMRCKRIELDAPSLCLALRDGAGLKAAPQTSRH